MRPGKISIGDYNDIVTITQQGVGDRDSIGGTVTNFFTPFEVWANVKQKATPYSEENGTIRYLDEYEILLRIPVSLNEGDLMTYDGKPLIVVSSVSYDHSKTMVKARGK